MHCISVRQVEDALIDSHAGAKKENSASGDDRPKKTFMAIAIGKLFVRFFRGSLNADHQQCLISRVRETMDAFREKRPGAGKKKTDKLENGD